MRQARDARLGTIHAVRFINCINGGIKTIDWNLRCNARILHIRGAIPRLDVAEALWHGN